MVNFDALEREKEKIRKMSLNELFAYGEKLYYSIFEHVVKTQSKDYISNELEGDIDFCNKSNLDQVNITIFSKIVNPKTVGRDIIKYFKNNSNIVLKDFCTYRTYINKSLRSYFLQNMCIYDHFCYEVVAYYVSKNGHKNEDDIKQEVKKWFDLRKSKEFKQSIAQDCFSIIHYMEGVEYMINEYLTNKMRI